MMVFAWDALHYIQCILYIVCNACTNTFILLNTTPDVSVDLSSMTASGDLLFVSQGDTKGWTAKEESPPEKRRFSLGKMTQIWVGEVEWSRTFINNCFLWNII